MRCEKDSAKTTLKMFSYHCFVFHISVCSVEKQVSLPLSLSLGEHTNVLRRECRLPKAFRTASVFVGEHHRDVYDIRMRDECFVSFTERLSKWDKRIAGFSGEAMFSSNTLSRTESRVAHGKCFKFDAIHSHLACTSLVSGEFSRTHNTRTLNRRLQCFRSLSCLIVPLR